MFPNLGASPLIIPWGTDYIAKESQFDEIYQQTSDNRRLRHHLLNVSLTFSASAVLHSLK